VCVCVWLGGGGFESMSVCRFITSERRPWFGPILIFIITTALLLDRPFDGFQHSRQLDVYDWVLVYLTASIIQRVMDGWLWWWIGKDVEGSSCGLYKGIIPAFVWKDWKRSWKTTEGVL